MQPQDSEEKYRARAFIASSHTVLLPLVFACTGPSEDTAASCPATPELHDIDPAAGFCVARNLSWLEKRQEYTHRVAALGGQAVRSDLHWHQVQATEGSWDWSVPDAILASTSQAYFGFVEGEEIDARNTQKPENDRPPLKQLRDFDRR